MLGAVVSALASGLASLRSAKPFPDPCRPACSSSPWGARPQRRGCSARSLPRSGQAGGGSVSAGTAQPLVARSAKCRRWSILLPASMEGSEELESSLLTQPWASVCFGESAFIAKACFRDSGYILLISDLSSVWYESVDAEAVGQRSKELNKRLTAHVSSFLHRLCNLMCPLLAGQPDTATSFSCHRGAGRLSVHVKSELSGLPFYWDFHCSAAPVEMVSRHLVRPLMRMSLVLQSQLQELASLLLQKDAEIEDYRESGAALSRDRLRTEPFQEETFLQNFMAESLPQICSAGDGQAFTSTLRQLYVAVTQQEAKQARKRHLSGDAEAPAPAGETPEHPDPPPQTQEDETAPSSKGATPASSPAQKLRLPMAKAKQKKAKGLFS
ncbi:non-homologous end-joining factor 1 isoform X3 [Struthio camelus]|uniref:non-homologous end-joining factor 1 isoform X3 n=1 Tax=Struthio camelus TaxID=8801 RepID=UPI003603C2B4